MIREFEDGMIVNDVFLVKDVVKGVTTAGLNYLNIVLQDSSGTIDAKKREIKDQDLNIFALGNVVNVNGEVYNYKGKLQFKIYGASIAKDGTDLTSLLIPSPIPVEVLEKKLRSYVSSIQNSDLKAIVNEVFKRYYSKFIEFPAAVKNHHEFYHGLIYHSVGMCDLAKEVAKLYNDVNYDLLISGCLLHDLGKVVELSGPVATKYTTEGNLLGHLTIGMSIVREIANELHIEGDAPLLLEHMILSHHGKLEFGAAVLPITREALLLSMIDDMDAKMMMLDKAYQDVPKGEYTERIFGLDNRSFYKGNI